MSGLSQGYSHHPTSKSISSDLFTAAEAFTLSQEGGWADNPADRGGPTMNGITLAVYRAWLGSPDATSAQLKAISSEQIQAIYKDLYWNPISGDLLQPGVGLSVFDAAVNIGVYQAARLLQACVGATRDGVIGPVTVGRARRMSPTLLISAYLSKREAYYRDCVSFAEFGRGWLARSQACFEAAARIAKADQA